MSYNYKKIDNSINEKHAIIQIENIQCIGEKGGFM